MFNKVSKRFIIPMPGNIITYLETEFLLKSHEKLDGIERIGATPAHYVFKRLLWQKFGNLFADEASQHGC